MSDSSSIPLIRQKAIALLARREHSRVELQEKLKKKGFVLEDITLTLQQLACDGWQSDDRFAECYVRSRTQAGFGPIRIAVELNRRGVPKFLMDKYLNRQDYGLWMSRIQLVWAKRFTEKASDQKAYAKQYRFLQQRGFPHENIIQILNGD